MDALSLSTEATYGADSKCHMLVEEATFVQCLFLRPTNLWKIPIPFRTAVCGPLALSCNIYAMLPVRADLGTLAHTFFQGCLIPTVPIRQTSPFAQPRVFWGSSHSNTSLGLASVLPQVLCVFLWVSETPFWDHLSKHVCLVTPNL